MKYHSYEVVVLCVYVAVGVCCGEGGGGGEEREGGRERERTLKQSAVRLPDALSLRSLMS